MMKLFKLVATVMFTACWLLQITQSGLSHAAANDLNADGKSDLIARNSTTGEINIWLMNGTTIVANNTVLNDPNWTVTHIADFNGDGKADIVYRNNDGSVAIWLMNGSALISGAGILGANSGWTVTHTGDFNGDGKADLLWRHTDGTIYVELINGTTLISGAGLLNAASGWSVTHVADFNGDGKADILYRHTDGRVAMWLMNGTTLASGAGILDAATGWSATHTADFNGDGKADILFRHTDGRIAMWLMNGITFIDGSGLLDAATGWSASHAADFNGDNKADLLFRHTDGRVAMWLMNGITFVDGGGLIDAGSGWSVIHTADFNGDGRADLVWRNAIDGSIATWLMNGLFPSNQTIVSGASAWRIVPFDTGTTPPTPGPSVSSPKVFYIHADHLGTPRTITRSTDNQKVWEWENTEAFGNNLPNENPSGLGAFTYNLRMPGQYFDKETGLSQNYFRDYDSSLGRYVQSDPIGLAAGPTTYAYVDGNPMSRSDPKGLFYPGGSSPFGPIQTTPPQGCSCPPVPPKPDDVSVCENVSSARNNSNPLWFYNQVRNKGPWDYKQLGSDYQELGNFNYGATGSAFGFPDSILYRMAGWAQRRAGTSKPEWGTPLGSAPYGDDPADQALIRQGIQYASCGCK